MPEMKEPIYHRQAFDTNASWRAFEDFKKIPAFCRDTPRLLEIYTEQVQKDPAHGQINTVPTLSHHTLSKWCSNYRWHDRAKAADAADQILLDMQREIATRTRVARQVEGESAQAEEFRSAMIDIGKGMVQFGSQVMGLVSTVTNEFQGKPLSDTDLEKLSKVAYIYRSIVSGGIPVGQEAWAMALGVQQAISVLDERTYP